MGTREPDTTGLEEAKSLNGQKPMSREMRRRIEYETEKAMKQFNALCTRFSDFIYNTDDLTDQMAEAKSHELNAKWRLYAKEHRLNKESITAFKEYCEKLYGAYKSELRGEGAELKSGEPEG